MEPVERTVQCLIEKRKVNPQISLCSRFPFDIIITDLIPFKSGLKDTSAIGSGNIIRSPVALTSRLRNAVIRNIDRMPGYIGDFLITRLPP